MTRDQLHVCSVNCQFLRKNMKLFCPLALNIVSFPKKLTVSKNNAPTYVFGDTARAHVCINSFFIKKPVWLCCSAAVPQSPWTSGVWFLNATRGRPTWKRRVVDTKYLGLTFHNIHLNHAGSSRRCSPSASFERFAFVLFFPTVAERSTLERDGESVWRAKPFRERAGANHDRARHASSFVAGRSHREYVSSELHSTHPTSSLLGQRKPQNTMADSAVDAVKETPIVEKETVTSSIKESPVKESPVKESPVKETNGTAEVVEKAENGTKNGTKENGNKVVEEEDEEEDEENGKEEEVSSPIKRKSCTADADAPDATQEKKPKIVEETDPVEETEEPVEA
ncbi:uncharacterized protein LOC143917749 [Arctopsyche grandis]|uniref:uncharacterized protein LOC143917749 n=1 Tax=Arctopsyche grandis TaxID=121162 RepID=UPI00406D89F6